MAPEILALIILGSIALGVFTILMLYLISVSRRSNIVLKKVDYLVEDLTYKSESLSVGVEAAQKISNYVLAADAFSQKGFKSMLTLFVQNKNFFYELIDKIKEDDTKKKTTKKRTQTKQKTRELASKKAAPKKTVKKATPKAKTTKAKTTKAKTTKKKK